MYINERTWRAIFDDFRDPFLSIDLRDAARNLDEDSDSPVKEVVDDLDSYRSITDNFVDGTPDVSVVARVSRASSDKKTITIGIAGIVDLVPFEDTEFAEEDDFDAYTEACYKDMESVYRNEVYPFVDSCEGFFRAGEQYGDVTILKCHVEPRFDFVDDECTAALYQVDIILDVRENEED